MSAGPHYPLRMRIRTSSLVAVVSLLCLASPGHAAPAKGQGQSIPRHEPAPTKKASASTTTQHKDTPPAPTSGVRLAAELQSFIQPPPPPPDRPASAKVPASASAELRKMTGPGKIVAMPKIVLSVDKPVSGKASMDFVGANVFHRPPGRKAYATIYGGATPKSQSAYLQINFTGHPDYYYVVGCNFIQGGRAKFFNGITTPWAHWKRDRTAGSGVYELMGPGQHDKPTAQRGYGVMFASEKPYSVEECTIQPYRHGTGPRG